MQCVRVGTPPLDAQGIASRTNDESILLSIYVKFSLIQLLLININALHSIIDSTTKVALNIGK